MMTTMRRDDPPDYVTGTKPPYEIQVPVTHPPHCVCRLKQCTARTDAQWSKPLVIRCRRKSPFPSSRPQSAVFAANFKRDEEDRLIAAVRESDSMKYARANAVPFERICRAYRQHLKDEGKRYDKAQPLIDALERFYGRRRDVASIDFTMYQELLAEVEELSAETKRHYANTLLAILNFAVAERIITSHGLANVRRPRVARPGTPVTWTKEELGVLLGPAMAKFERTQEGSFVPLRGLCYVAYFTLMRPKNNLALTWGELSIDQAKEAGTFHLDQHKNANKGIKAEGPLAAQLAAYLRSIRPADASGLVHPNPETGAAYVDIRKQWNKLVAIASEILEYELLDKKADFFTFRHTGASHLAEKCGHNPMLLAKMMGDTNIETIRKHYCNLDLVFMAEMIQGWELPEATEKKEEPKWGAN